VPARLAVQEVQEVPENEVHSTLRGQGQLGQGVGQQGRSKVRLWLSNAMKQYARLVAKN
jgi:hypothetical protein